MKTIKRDNIAIGIVIILVLVYIFYECYSVTHIELKTETASLTTVYESVDTTAIAVRDEHTIASAADGVTVACLNNGDKVNVGGNVAMNFSNADQAATYSKYLELQQKLEYYENIEAQTVGRAASVESINRQIDENVNSYIQAIEQGNIQMINSTSDTVNDDLLSRQLIIGENVDLVSIIQDIRNQLSSYSVTAPNGYITTDQSGVFSDYTDGLENYVDYENVTNLNPSDVNSAIEKINSNTADTSSNAGKLITSYNWYFVCVVSADDAKNFSNGDKVKVALKDNENTDLTFKIVSGAETSVGQEETVLVLQSSEMNGDLASIRSAEIEIRYNSYEGFKAPASAVHVVDDKKGVYVLISSQVKFREANIIYTTDDYVLLSYDADNLNGIRIYDKIITQGKDLEDGKVYT